MTLRERLLERLLIYVIKGRGSACWMWDGPRSGAGYGIFRFEGKTYNARRTAFELYHGKVGENTIRCTCRNTSCVRPDHLYLSSTAKGGRKTHAGT